MSGTGLTAVFPLAFFLLFRLNRFMTLLGYLPDSNPAVRLGHELYQFRACRLIEHSQKGFPIFIGDGCGVK